MVHQKWSGRLDSNQRPHAPQACALPGCATSRVPDLVSCQRTNVKRLLRASLRLLLEQRQQFAQFRRQLFQTLSLFRGAWTNASRITRRRYGLKKFAFTKLRLLCLRLSIVLATDDLQLPTAAKFVIEPLLRPRDRVLVFVKQFLDTQRHLDVAFAIDTLARTILLRREHRKLRFPVAQHVRLHSRQLANLTDFEEQLFGYDYRGTTH